MKERLANVIRWMGRIWLGLAFLLVLYHLYQSIKGSPPDSVDLLIITVLAFIPSAVSLSIAYIIDGKIDSVTTKVWVAFIAVIVCLFIANNFQTKTKASANPSSKQATGKEWWANDQVVAPDISKLSDKELLELIDKFEKKDGQSGVAEKDWKELTRRKGRRSNYELKSK